MVNNPHTVTMYPCNFNQPRVDGMTIAGTDTRKARKTKTAFAIAAVITVSPQAHPYMQDGGGIIHFAGHTSSSRFRDTVSTVGVLLVSDSIIKANMIKRPPAATKRMSAATYARRMLSLAILSDFSRGFANVMCM